MREIGGAIQGIDHPAVGRETFTGRRFFGQDVVIRDRGPDDVENGPLGGQVDVGQQIAQPLAL